MSADDDDFPQLPADTLLALREFQSEKSARAQQFEALKSQAENSFQDQSRPDAADDGTPLSMDLFGEDWNASQFWYTDSTASLLAKQLLENADEGTRIAVVSAPSVYVAIRNLLSSSSSRPQVKLFEYDDRFAVLGPDFVKYDFKTPLGFPAELRGKFDRVICDPPFLSEDCQAKTAVTVRALVKNWGEEGEGLRFISCTGERMQGTVLRLYGKIGVRTTTFEPEHRKGLSNEFWCYANFECGDWKWRGRTS